MLVGRTVECGILEQLLQDARVGRSSAMVLRGEPGIGKSALLRHAVKQAREFLLLQTRGVESEAEMAFAGLTDLTRPLLGYLPSLPEVQAAALSGALALGPPTGGDRFTISVATLTLLGLAAERQPVLVVVDDAHWLDGPSLDVVLFAARRLGAESVVLLLAVRDDAPGPLDVDDLNQLVVRGLNSVATAELLRRELPVPVAPAVVASLVERTAGNPLALLEVVPLLSRAQLAGTAPLAEPLPAGGAVERAFLRRVAALPAAVGAALLVAAASDTGELATVAGALERLGVDLAALETAESEGLVALDGRGRVEFRHPLLRGAIYHGASPPARRSAHRALAAALEDLDQDRWAWHLAGAAVAPDEEVAAALQRTAIRVRERGGWGAAARALERAACLSPDPERLVHRLAAAAEAFWFAGQLDHAVDVVKEALPVASDPLLRSDLQRLHGTIEGWSGDMTAARQLMVDEANRVIEADPARAALMLADAALLFTGSGRVRSAVRIAQEAYRLAQAAPESTQAYVATSLGSALVLAGRGSEGYPMILGARDALQRADEATLTRAVLGVSSQAGVWLEAWEQAGADLAEAIRRARERGSPGSSLPFHLELLSELEFRAGRWDEAAADAAEAIQLTTDTGQRNLLGYGLVCLARVDAARGMEGACRSEVAEACQLAVRYGIRPLELYAASVLGLLELGFSRLDATISHLAPLGEFVVEIGLGEPAAVQWAPDLIEAYIRAGRTAEAIESLERFEREAQATGRTWALAAAARCRGLLADPAQSGAAFDAAYAWHGRTSMPFELARTRLCHGEQLRRAKQRTAAREALRTSLATFEKLDARPWADRASAELRATGESARRREVSAVRRLTPQEFQVARLVGEGRSNREIAAALFLSPKTVEFHLSNIHRKLDTGSRAQLVRRLVQERSI